MKNILKNYIYNSGYDILNLILPLVTAPYLARILGAEGVGLYAFYFTIAQWFCKFAKLGLGNYGTRELARERHNKDLLIKKFSELYVLQIINTIVITIIYAVFVIFIADNKLLASFFGIWVFGSIFDIDWLYFGLESFKTAAIRNCFVKITSTLAVFLLVKTKDDVVIYVLITSISYLAGFMFLWLSKKEYIRFDKIEFKNVFSHLKPCLLLLIPVIALSIYRSMDKVMLGYLSNMSETGYYEYAEKLIYALCALIASFGTVMMPRMSNLAAKKDKETSKIYMENSIIFLIFLSAGMCFGLLSISRSLIPILFGIKFERSIQLLNMLAVTLIFIAWANVIRTQYIIPQKRDSIYIWSISLGAIANLIVNCILIPRYGASGACIGTIIAELIVPLYQYIILRKELPFKIYMRKTFPFIILGFFMFTICIAIERTTGTGFLPMIIQIIIGGLVYTVMSLIYLNKFLKIKILKKLPETKKESN